MSANKEKKKGYASLIRKSATPYALIAAAAFSATPSITHAQNKQAGQSQESYVERASISEMEDIVSTKNATPQSLEKIVRDIPNSENLNNMEIELLKKVASHKNSNQFTLGNLCTRIQPEIRQAVAENPVTKLNILLQLRSDKDENVRQVASKKAITKMMAPRQDSRIGVIVN
jgi:hypothetical protein